MIQLFPKNLSRPLSVPATVHNQRRTLETISRAKAKLLFRGMQSFLPLGMSAILGLIGTPAIAQSQDSFDPYAAYRNHQYTPSEDALPLPSEETRTSMPSGDTIYSDPHYVDPIASNPPHADTYIWETAPSITDNDIVLFAPEADTDPNSDDMLKSDAVTIYRPAIEPAPKLPPTSPDTVSALTTSSDDIDESRWSLTLEKPGPSDSELYVAPPSSAPLSMKQPDIAPFHMTAEQYLEHRATQLERQRPYAIEQLTYDVSLDTKFGTPIRKQITIGVGDDFAYQTEAGSTSMMIFDFAFNRILEVTTKTSPQPRFSNRNIMPIIQRNVERINALTETGSLDRITHKGQSYDAFWLESEARYSAADRRDDFEVQKTNATSDRPATVMISYKGQSVLDADYSATPFNTSQQHDVMRRYTYFNWPLHPQIIESAVTDHPFERLELTTQIGGKTVRQSWVLSSRISATEPFPLPPNAQVETILPTLLITALQKAEQSKDAGQHRTIETIAQNIRSALRSEDYLGAWLEGQSYLSYGMNAQISKCPHDDICEAMGTIERQADHTPELAAMIKNFKDARTMDGRVIAAQRLNSWLNENPPHPAVLRTLAKTMMAIDPALAQTAQLDKNSIGELLITALAIGPFDKQNYLGLAQYYLGQKQVEEAWNIYDVMRVLLEPAELTDLTIDKVESELKRQASGYFNP